MNTFGFLTLDSTLAVGLVLFILFGILAIQKAISKSRESQKTNTSNGVHIESQKQSGGIINTGDFKAEQVFEGGTHYHGSNSHGAQTPNRYTGLPSTWNDVEFLAWNPSEVYHASCGIEVINNKGISLDGCYAELLAIYEEEKGEYKKFKNIPPCNLAWIINNKRSFESIEIEPTKHKYLGLVFPTIGINDLQFYGVIGKGFDFGWGIERRILIVEFEVSGKLETRTIKPKRLFATISRTGNKFSVTEIKNTPPENFYE